MLPLDPPISPLAGRGDGSPLDPISKTERELFSGARQDAAVRCRFARHLLDRNPDSLTGRIILASHAESAVETEALLRDAVRIGLQLWQRELDGELEVRWFDDPATRPFMAAVSAYGSTLARRGLHGAAAECADFLLVLDPGDRMQVGRFVQLSGAGEHSSGVRPG